MAYGRAVITATAGDPASYGEWSGIQRFDTPTAFSARDEMDHSAGSLTGKTAPVGGTWAVVNASPGTDFAVDTAAHTVTRTATGGNGRFVRVGSGTHTVTAAQVDLMVSTVSAVTYGGLISRYVDTSNFVHVALLPPGNVDFNLTVAGVTSTVSAGLGGIGEIAANTWYSLRVAIDAGGVRRSGSGHAAGSPATRC